MLQYYRVKTMHSFESRIKHLGEYYRIKSGLITTATYNPETDEWKMGHKNRWHSLGGMADVGQTLSIDLENTGDFIPASIMFKDYKGENINE